MKPLKLLVYAQLFALLQLIPHFAASGQGIECPPGCGPGRWANEAVALSLVRSKAPYETRDIRVASPDHLKAAHIVKDKWWVEVGGAEISPGPRASSIFYPAELAWAPDSRALYITEGSGYSTGYRVRIYRLESGSRRYVKGVNSTIHRDFERRHKCSEGQLPNVAGMHWMGDSQRLLIVAEVPPIGICPDMEYFGGYLVSIPTGQIVERYDPQELEDRWKDALGYRLTDDFYQLSAEQKTTRVR
jgi:hypothetical protein